MYVLVAVGHFCLVWSMYVIFTYSMLPPWFMQTAFGVNSLTMKYADIHDAISVSLVCRYDAALLSLTSATIRLRVDDADDV